MNITAINTLRPLDLQFHVILPGRFAVLPLLPAVAVPPIADPLPAVQHHGPAFGSVIPGVRDSEAEKRANAS
jgi:hypothetical protein